MNLATNISGFSGKMIAAIILIITAVYTLLFGFILPVNDYFPGPLLILESFADLITEYGLFKGFTLTTFLVYTSFVTALFIVYIFRGFLLRKLAESSIIESFIKITGIFSVLFIVLLVNIWTHGSVYAEFIVLFLTAFIQILTLFAINIGNVPEEYIQSGQSLGKGSSIFKEIYWNSILPDASKSFTVVHSMIWIMALLYEFVGGGGGLGTIYAEITSYNDLAGLFALAIFTGIIFSAGDFIIKYLAAKIIFWE